ncbi:MAG: hypothetical protein AAF602_09670 [Myxococcota bacterium]
MRLPLALTFLALVACDTAKTDDVEALQGTLDRLAADLQAANIQIADLQTQVAALSQVDVVDLEARLGSAEGAVAMLETTTVAQTLAITQASDGLTLVETTVANVQGDVATLQSDAAALATYLTVDSAGDALVITGANLLVRSGSGSTDGATNGLGNVIIGYNEDDALDRTGSHNLVLGMRNDYESHGSIVGGRDNQVTAPFTVVTSGELNAATTSFAVVNTGQLVDASGPFSWVGTCYDCDASDRRSAVVTGEYQTSAGQSSSVLGGYGNAAEGNWTTVNGWNNVATSQAQLSSVLGGEGNVVTGVAAVVTGGLANTATGSHEVLP